jgi:hypothetical protein
MLRRFALQLHLELGQSIAGARIDRLGTLDNTVRGHGRALRGHGGLCSSRRSRLATKAPLGQESGTSARRRRPLRVRSGCGQAPAQGVGPPPAGARARDSSRSVVHPAGEINGDVRACEAIGDAEGFRAVGGRARAAPRPPGPSASARGAHTKRPRFIHPGPSWALQGTGGGGTSREENLRDARDEPP